MKSFVRLAGVYKGPGGKISGAKVLNLYGTELGDIIDYGPWRKFVFNAKSIDMVFDAGCLRDIANMCEAIRNAVDGAPPVEDDGLPLGTVLLHCGAVDTIPAGWYLCDGKRGAPDFTQHGNWIIKLGPRDDAPIQEDKSAADQKQNRIS